MAPHSGLGMRHLHASAIMSHCTAHSGYLRLGVEVVIGEGRIPWKHHKRFDEVYGIEARHC